MFCEGLKMRSLAVFLGVFVLLVAGDGTGGEEIHNQPTDCFWLWYFFGNYACDNGKEICYEQRCDGVEDCPSAEDENDCRCFLYPIGTSIYGEELLSPQYNLQDNQDNYLSINPITGGSTFIKVLDETNTILIELNYDSWEKPTPTTSKMLTTNEEFSTLVFRRHADKMKIALRDDMQNEITLNTIPKTIRVKADFNTNVAFNCPEGCYEFEKTDIRKYFPKESVNTEVSFNIYGRIKDTSKPLDSRVAVCPCGRYIDVGSVLSSESDREGPWREINFHSTLTKDEDGRYSCDDLEVTEPEIGKSIPYSGTCTVYGFKPSIWLNFWYTSNIRWAAPCVPSSPKGDIIKSDNIEGDNIEGDNIKGDNIESDNNKGDNIKYDNNKGDNIKGDSDLINSIMFWFCVGVVFCF